MTLDVSSTEPVQFGRRLLHDPASRRYATTLTEPIPGKSVRHLLAAPHVDQFYLNGCVGFAGTNALNTLAAVRSRRKYNTWRRGAYTSMILDNSDGIENYHRGHPVRFVPRHISPRR